jgi:hypothetical protein
VYTTFTAVPLLVYASSLMTEAESEVPVEGDPALAVSPLKLIAVMSKEAALVLVPLSSSTIPLGAPLPTVASKAVLNTGSG